MKWFWFRFLQRDTKQFCVMALWMACVGDAQCAGKHRQTPTHTRHLHKHKYPPVHKLTLISQYTMCQSTSHCFHSLMWAESKWGLFYSIISKQTIRLLSVLPCCVAADARCQLTRNRKCKQYLRYFEIYLEVPLLHVSINTPITNFSIYLSSVRHICLFAYLLGWLVVLKLKEQPLTEYHV